METPEKRCLKITNSRQFQILVSLMEKNTQLAKCLPTSGSGKITVEEAWNDVAREVNLYGPPKRTGCEWKKIWCDLKSRTKKKILENNKNMNIRGEGSCRKLYLNGLEQSIDRILNLSTKAASHVLDESLKESTLDSVCNEMLKPYEVKTEPDDNEPNIQMAQSPETPPTKKTKPVAQFRVLGKRKYEKTEKQFKLLQQQVKSQEKILEVMQMQATATKAIAEAAVRQAEAMSIIADSTQSIALAVQDAVKYLERY